MGRRMSSVLAMAADDSCLLVLLRAGCFAAAAQVAVTATASACMQRDLVVHMMTNEVNQLRRACVITNQVKWRLAV